MVPMEIPLQIFPHYQSLVVRKRLTLYIKDEEELNYSAQLPKTRCVLKHKCPRTRPIPEVAVIVKTKIQGQGQKLWH
jgi:hypothetical protein